MDSNSSPFDFFCNRDLTIANMSEKIKKLERDLRSTNTQYSQGMAELHVCNLTKPSTCLYNSFKLFAAAG